MTRNFDSILEHCLSQIGAGKATIWNCLARYPDLAGELEPLLVAAEEMWAIPKPVLSSEARARIASRVLEAADTRPRPRPPATNRPGFRFGWRWAAVGFSAFFVVVLLFSVLVISVGQTLPGSPLHTIKLAIEDTWILLAPKPEEPRLRLEFARRRLDEVTVLTQNGSVDVAVVDAMTEETEAALSSVEELPPEMAVALVDDLTTLIEDQKNTLSELLDNDSTTSPDKVNAALQVNAVQNNRLQVLRSSLPMPPAISVVAAADLSSVPEPGGMVQFTIRATNNGVEDITLISLVDEIHGDLNGQGTCLLPPVGISLAPGESYGCVFSSRISGNAGDRDSGAVTVVAADNEGYVARVSAAATVTIVDALPAISVSKVPRVSNLPEPGDMVRFTVRVTNDGVEEVILTSLVDDVHGNLDGRGTCSTSEEEIALSPHEWYECTYSADVFGNAGETKANTLMAVAADDEGNLAKAVGSASITFTDVLPQIGMSMVVNPSRVPEPGATVQFTVRVVNNSVEGVTLTSLADDAYGDLNGRGTCSVPLEGVTLSPDGSYTCTFSAALSGNAGDSETHTATAVAADDEGNSVERADGATIVFTDVLPEIGVSKTASPVSVPEPGSTSEFTVRVTNYSVEDVVLNSLIDDVYGDLDGQGTCSIPSVGVALRPGGSYKCAFSVEVSGNAGDTETDTVTAVAADDEGNQVKAADSVTVSVTDVLPEIWVSKTVNPSSVPEPGGTAQFTVQVTNRSVEKVIVSSLVDDEYGDLNGQGTCSVPRAGLTLDPGESFKCTFRKDVAGNAGDIGVNTVTAVAADDEGNLSKAADSATVRFTDVLPQLSVSKTANPTSVPEPGGDVQFTVQVTNNSVEEVFLSSLIDNVYGDLNGQGSCSVPRGGLTLGVGGSYRCAFNAEISGNAGDVERDTVTAQASDDEGNEVEDSDAATVTVVDVLPVIEVTTTAKTSSIPEPGDTVQLTVEITNDSVEDVSLFSLEDQLLGDLDGRGTCSLPSTGMMLSPGASYGCVFSVNLTGHGGDTKVDKVTAIAIDDEENEATASGSASVRITDVLPVIAVSKMASPSTLPEPGGWVDFEVWVTNDSVEEVVLTSLVDDIYGALNGQGTCSLASAGITIAPRGTYGCRFGAEVVGNAGKVETSTVTAQAFDDEGNRAEAADGATVGFTDVVPVITVSKTANPGSLPEPGGFVEITVRVTNSGVESVMLTSLVDDIHGDLNGRGTCFVPAAGVALGPGASYGCSFTVEVLGNAGHTEVDTVTARAADDEGNEVASSDSATVSITDAPPTIGVTKTVDPGSLPEPGGWFQFTVRVTNQSVEDVALTSLVDDLHGNLDGKGTCVVSPQGRSIGPGEWYECTFGVEVLGNAGYSETDTVTAVASDDEGNTAMASDSATVTITDKWPVVNLGKTADPSTVTAPGGPVLFTVLVTNNSVEDVIITSLVDDVYGDLAGQGTCTVPAGGITVSPAGSYECTFSGDVFGAAGETKTDTARAVVMDDEGNAVEAADSATVTIVAQP